jgi:bifunctional ADP-heptose synthase (sugar kinase/adenylyltransferase)
MEGSIVKLSKVPWTATTPREKVRTIAELGAITEQLRRSGRKVVQAHGTFDLLHVGQVRHLAAARAVGDILVVTLTADRWVKPTP